MTREQHQPSLLTAAPIHVEETPSVEAGKKTTCRNQRVAPSFGIAARIDDMSPPCRT
jgi:hypothetical protein